MRYLILLFVIPLVSQSDTVRGQVCTAQNIIGQDEGCCKTPMLSCNQVTPGGESCCIARNTNTNLAEGDKCKYNTNTNTCVTKKDLTCLVDIDTNKIKNKCELTNGIYRHGDTLSGACESGYTGSCSYTCNYGEIKKVSNTCTPSPSDCPDNVPQNYITGGGNYCNRLGKLLRHRNKNTAEKQQCCNSKANCRWVGACYTACPATTKDKCVLPKTGGGAFAQGTCFNTNGRCRYYCTNATRWTIASNLTPPGYNTCGYGSPCSVTNSKINDCGNLNGTGTVHGGLIRGTNASGGECVYQCNNGTWEVSSNTVLAERPCQETKQDNCVLGKAIHNDFSGECYNQGCIEHIGSLSLTDISNYSIILIQGPDFTWRNSCTNKYYSGSCRYKCNNGNWERKTNNCSLTTVTPCPRSKIGNCKTLPKTSVYGTYEIGCINGYSGNAKFTCNTQGTWVTKENNCVRL